MAPRNLLPASILLMVSLIFSFVVGEVGLRLLGYAGAPEFVISNIRQVDDHILNWRYVPGSTSQVGDVVYHYNSAGFRDREHTIEKAVGITRILVMGDSVTEGYGVKQDAMFASQIQRILGDKFEIINHGMNGLNTPQEVHVLDAEGLRYKPDMVLLNFVLNDCEFFTEFDALSRYQDKKDSRIALFGEAAVDPRFKRLLKSSALIYFVKARVAHFLALMSGEKGQNDYVMLWNKPECRERVLDGFDALHRLKEQHGFDVQVLIWPVLVNYEGYEFSFIHEWVAEVAEQRGFKVLDLLSVYSSKRYRALQITAEDHWHPNGTGHRLAAEAYVTWIHRSD
jgi:lysophospholipase L1-like esterase